jgi:hypothetical protein
MSHNSLSQIIDFIGYLFAIMYGYLFAIMYGYLFAIMYGYLFAIMYGCSKSRCKFFPKYIGTY